MNGPGGADLKDSAAVLQAVDRQDDDDAAAAAVGDDSQESLPGNDDEGAASAKNGVSANGAYCCRTHSSNSMQIPFSRARKANLASGSGWHFQSADPFFNVAERRAQPFFSAAAAAVSRALSRFIFPLPRARPWRIDLPLDFPINRDVNRK